MRDIKLLRLWILLVLLLCTSKVFAQQSFFNAFSGDRTEHHRHFYQGQSNISDSRVILNNTYNYGLFENFELGVNWLDIPLTSLREVPNDEEVLVNGQYFFDVTSYLQLSTGFQAGVVTQGEDRNRYAQLMYLNSKWEFSEWDIKYVLGVLFGNNNYMSSDNLVVQTGLEIPIVKDHLHFVTDYISGQTENSVGVVGFAYFFTPEWSLSTGYMYPAHTSDNHSGAVIELTFVQKPSH